MKVFWALILGIAASVSLLQAQAQTNPFDITAANKTLNTIESQFSNYRISKLESVIRQLGKLENQAQTCAKTASGQLKTIQELLGTTANEANLKSESIDAKYLASKQSIYQSRLVNCRLFLFRSSELINKLKLNIEKLSTQEIMERTDSIFSAISKSLSMTAAEFKKEIAIHGVDWEKARYFFIAALGFLALVMLMKTYVKKRAIRTPSIIVLSLMLSGYATRVLYTPFQLSEPFFELMQALYILVIGIPTYFAFRALFTKPHHPKIIGALIIVPLVIINLIAMAGFYQLALLLVDGLILTGLLTALLWLTLATISLASHQVDDKDVSLAKTIRRYLGIKPHKTFVEVYLLRAALYATVIIVFGLALLSIWGLSVLYIDQIKLWIFHGFTFVGMPIIPARIIMALVVFSLIHIAARFLATQVAMHYQRQAKAELQVTVASIIGYVGFVLATVIALLFAGVNFTGLAIIAGALSVGIGLGLQSIVNNFISGVILLLEKPIKPGDRIHIGDVEGIVKKIRIRSTQIETRAREDVIVPNAELITTRVTNYMFRNSRWRVSCYVGLAYQSDVDKARELLLEIAGKHPEVIQDPPNEPKVLFREFTDNNLKFELRCVIHNVNRKNFIASDLNFEINKAFKEHGITVAYPQRDIHIKDLGPLKDSD